MLSEAQADLCYPGTPAYDEHAKRLAEDPSLTPTGDAHRMVLAGVLRQFPEGTALAHALQASALDASHTTVVGVRGRESAQIRKVEQATGIDIWRMERLELDGEQAYRSLLERHLVRGPIVLSVDVRGLDPHLMSAVNDPVSDGLDWSFLKRSLEQCLPHVDRILGLDICELDPLRDEAHSIAQVRFAETVGPFLRKISR